LRCGVDYRLHDVLPWVVREGTSINITTWDLRRPKKKRVFLGCYDAPEGETDYTFCENTLGNANAAARSRVFAERPEPTTGAIRDLERVLKKASYKLGGAMRPRMLSDSELVEWINTLPRRKRVRYLEAVESLKTTPFDFVKDSQIKCFIKLEVIPRKRDPKPRMIQYRTARYLVTLAKYLRPLEHVLYESKGVFSSDGVADFAKSHNMDKRAATIREKASRLKEPVAVGIDAASFDAHVSRPLLKAEHKFYTWMARAAGWAHSDVALLTRILRMQLKNHVTGIFEEGMIKYVVDGNRMSGDLNTAAGNCILMAGMVKSILDRVIDKGKWVQYDDGDDDLLLVEKDSLGVLLKEIKSEFEEMGMDIKIESRADIGGDRLEGVLFCQHRPVCLDGKWTMVPCHERCETRLMNGPRWHHSRDELRQYLGAQAVCRLQTLNACPVLGAMYQWAARNGDTSQAAFDRVTEGDYRKFPHTPVPPPVEPSPGSRDSYARAYGVSPEEQVRLEQLWESWPSPVPDYC
jgi:hypothetical protein